MYSVVGLSKLFKGDGFTMDEQGNIGFQEYLMPNTPLVEIKDHIVIDLTVTQPQ